jgi:DNA-binding GntR family transcriptional regulator
MVEPDPGPWLVGRPEDRLPVSITTRVRIAETLRDLIITGQLAEGDRIDLDGVAADFGTSRTPVREACLALIHEGLVRVAPRSGVQVVGLTPQATLDNFSLMARLSGVAAEWAAQRMNGEQLGRVSDLKDAAARSDGDLARANWYFHREINKACGSTRLVMMLADAGRMIPRRFFDLFPQHIPCSLGEHDEIVEALAVRDGPRAREVTERHFDGAAVLLSKHLRRMRNEVPAHRRTVKSISRGVSS